MAGLSFVKTIFLPLLAAAVLYSLVSFVLLPLHRRYIRRYQHYLPLSAPPGASPTSTTAFWLLARVEGAYAAVAQRLPFMRTRRDASTAAHLYDDDDDDDDFDIEDGEGEGMVGFDPVEREGRREVLDSRRIMSGGGFGGGGGRGGRPDEMGRSERRLSRELEVGFRDSSSDESEDGEGGANGRRGDGRIQR